MTNYFEDSDLDFLKDLVFDEEQENKSQPFVPQVCKPMLQVGNAMSPHGVHLVKSTHKLSRRIANVNDLVLQVKQLQQNVEAVQLREKQLEQEVAIAKQQLLQEQKNHRRELQDFRKSADDVRCLYDTERIRRRESERKAEYSTEKLEGCEKELANMKLENDQLKAQHDELKGPIPYKELVIKYLRLGNIKERGALHWQDKNTIDEMTRYCKEKKIRLPPSVNQSPKRSTPKTAAKVDQSVQVELIQPKAEAQPKVTQCHLPQTRDSSTQHISTTTTRSTSTDCFIKKRSVSTNFPEPKTVLDILKEFSTWVVSEPVQPIAEPEPLVMDSDYVANHSFTQTRTIGTCTLICNVQRAVDYQAESFKFIKRSNSRPPSRLMDAIKHETATAPTATPMNLPDPVYFENFETFLKKRHPGISFQEFLLILVEYLFKQNTVAANEFLHRVAKDPSPSVGEQSYTDKEHTLNSFPWNEFKIDQLKDEENEKGKLKNSKKTHYKPHKMNSTDEICSHMNSYNDKTEQTAGMHYAPIPNDPTQSNVLCVKDPILGLGHKSTETVKDFNVEELKTDLPKLFDVECSPDPMKYPTLNTLPITTAETNTCEGFSHKSIFGNEKANLKDSNQKSVDASEKNRAELTAISEMDVDHDNSEQKGFSIVQNDLKLSDSSSSSEAECEHYNCSNADQTAISVKQMGEWRDNMSSSENIQTLLPLTQIENDEQLDETTLLEHNSTETVKEVNAREIKADLPNPSDLKYSPDGTKSPSSEILDKQISIVQNDLMLSDSSSSSGAESEHYNCSKADQTARSVNQMGEGRDQEEQTDETTLLEHNSTETVKEVNAREIKADLPNPSDLKYSPDGTKSPSSEILDKQISIVQNDLMLSDSSSSSEAESEHYNCSNADQTARSVNQMGDGRYQEEQIDESTLLEHNSTETVKEVNAREIKADLPNPSDLKYSPDGTKSPSSEILDKQISIVQNDLMLSDSSSSSGAESEHYNCSKADQTARSVNQMGEGRDQEEQTDETTLLEHNSTETVKEVNAREIKADLPNPSDLKYSPDGTKSPSSEILDKQISIVQNDLMLSDSSSSSGAESEHYNCSNADQTARSVNQMGEGRDQEEQTDETTLLKHNSTETVKEVNAREIKADLPNPSDLKYSPDGTKSPSSEIFDKQDDRNSSKSSDDLIHILASLSDNDLTPKRDIKYDNNDEKNAHDLPLKQELSSSCSSIELNVQKASTANDINELMAHSIRRCSNESENSHTSSNNSPDKTKRKEEDQNSSEQLLTNTPNIYPKLADGQQEIRNEIQLIPDPFMLPPNNVTSRSQDKLCNETDEDEAMLVIDLPEESIDLIQDEHSHGELQNEETKMNFYHEAREVIDIHAVKPETNNQINASAPTTLQETSSAAKRKYLLNPEIGGDNTSTSAMPTNGQSAGKRKIDGDETSTSPIQKKQKYVRKPKISGDVNLVCKRSERLAMKMKRNAPGPSQESVKTKIGRLNEPEPYNEVFGYEPVHRTQRAPSCDIGSNELEQDTKEMCYREQSPIASCNVSELESPASPIQPDISTEEIPRTEVKPIPLELHMNESLMESENSVLLRLINTYSHPNNKLSRINKDHKERNRIIKNLRKEVKSYLSNTKSNVEAPQVVNMLDSIANVRPDSDELIAQSIIDEMLNAPLELRPDAETMIMPEPRSECLGRIALIIQQLQRTRVTFTMNFQHSVDHALFMRKEDFKQGLPCAINLLHLYLLTIRNPTLGRLPNNPARWLIVKCLYYHKMKAHPLIYEVLCMYPTVLPHREEHTYDRSDPVITVIEHLLMSHKYDMQNNELRHKDLLSKLRYQYHFHPHKPERSEVLRNLMEKIRVGKLDNVPYAFMLLCKQMHPQTVMTNILTAHLMPLAKEYYAHVTETDENDERVACVIECISYILRPFPLDTKVDTYLYLYGLLLNAVNRQTVQEAAVRAVIRLQRFAPRMCYSVLVRFKSTDYELTPETKAMLKSFVYRRPLPYWREAADQ